MEGGVKAQVKLLEQSSPTAGSSLWPQKFFFYGISYN